MNTFGARVAGSRTVLVTGGAGFIGSALVRRLIRNTKAHVVNFDKLTYAGNLDSLTDVEDSPRYEFFRGAVENKAAVREAMERFRPDAVVHLAAESHVDRSIDGPQQSITTNVVGTFSMLEESRRYWLDLPSAKAEDFRFIHVSTDEVYGALGPDGVFTERTPYDPSSPYSASKAGSDHLARAWHRTYDFPTIVTNCSNNYGPFQFPEKLIPLMILNAMEYEALPVYGQGKNVRDWIHVEDHADALIRVLSDGSIGETYLVGGRCEKRNIEVVRTVAELVDEERPDPSKPPRTELIQFVEDRPGHDYRYAIDPTKIEDELGWSPNRTFEEGLQATVRWYLENEWWWKRVQSGAYARKRLGLGGNDPAANTE